MARRRPPDKVRRFKRTKNERDVPTVEEVRRQLVRGGEIDDSVADPSARARDDASEAARGDG